MVRKKHLWVFWIVAWSVSAQAQSVLCESATSLCGQIDSTLSLDHAFDLPNADALQGDILGDNVRMVRFHTTDLIPNGQGVSVEVTGWSCEGDFQLRVYQPNTFNDCDALEYLPASDLLRASGDTTLVTEELYRNWDYILLISSDQVGCELNVKLTGRSMSIDACCAANIDYGDSTQVEVLGSDWMLGFDWVPEEYASMSGDRQATLAPYQTTTFFVTAYIEECAYQAAVLVAVGEPIVAPNAFTPNGDDENDTWEIKGLASFEAAVVEVFDRWGQLVYRSVSYPNPWNGNFRGRPAPEGTYFYVIHLNEPNADLPPRTGSVSIIR